MSASAAVREIHFAICSFSWLSANNLNMSHYNFQSPRTYKGKAKHMSNGNGILSKNLLAKRVSHLPNEKPHVSPFVIMANNAAMLKQSIQNSTKQMLALGVVLKSREQRTTTAFEVAGPNSREAKRRLRQIARGQLKVKES